MRSSVEKARGRRSEAGNIYAEAAAPGVGEAIVQAAACILEAGGVHERLTEDGVVLENTGTSRVCCKEVRKPHSDRNSGSAR